MDAPPLRTATEAAVSATPRFMMDGTVEAAVVIKQRFAVVRGKVERCEGAEIHPVDVPWDPEHPERSSVRFPADVGPAKVTTDVIVVGSAMAPARLPSESLDVRVLVGALRKRVRVYGARTWYKGARGMRLSDPIPFESVELRWELAWGGSDFTPNLDPIEEPRNPVGRGLVRDPDSLLHQLGPQIEDPEALIRTHKDAPPPAGVAALGRHWAPRRQYAGTADERWMRERMPLPPLDQDPRFHQRAAPGLVAHEPLRGGEPVTLENLSALGVMDFELPRLHFFVGLKARGALREFPPMIDTVLLLPNEARLEVVWRSSVPLPRRAREVEYVQVHEKARVG